MKNLLLFENVYAVFPELINPHADVAEEQMKKWFGECRLLSTTQRKQYQAAGLGVCAARYFPAAGRELLICLSKFMLWGFLHDDLYGDATAQELRPISDRTLSILKGMPPASDDNELYQQCAAFRDQLVIKQPLHWQQHFFSNVKTYLEGMILEAPYKNTMQFPSLATYLEIRRKTVGLDQFIDLMEISLGAILPAEIYYHRVLQELRELTALVIALANDLFSTGKERGVDVMNYVFVYEKEYGVAYEEAYDRCLQLHNEYIRSFVALSSSLPDFGASLHIVERYVDGLGSLMKGSYCWHKKDTARYTLV